MKAVARLENSPGETDVSCAGKTLTIEVDFGDYSAAIIETA